MIVADTGAVLALIDSSDRHHRSLRALFEAHPTDWLLPWAILAEVDYLLQAHVGNRAQRAFQRDLASGAWPVEWGEDGDLDRANDLCRRYAALNIGLVDGVVAAVAERVGATAIATLDLRDFGAMRIAGAPRLFPRDL